MTDIVPHLRKLADDARRLTTNSYRYDEAADEIKRLRDTLVKIDEMVEDYADADDGQPNLAMRIMTIVRAALEKSPPSPS